MKEGIHSRYVGEASMMSGYLAGVLIRSGPNVP